VRLQCYCRALQLPGIGRPARKRVNNLGGSCKRYRLELGAGELVKEGYEKWQECLPYGDSDVDLLHRALDSLKFREARQ